MVSLLRSNHHGVPVLTLLILGIFGAIPWVFPSQETVMPGGSMPLMEVLYQSLGSGASLWQAISIVLTIAQAALLIGWNQKYDILPRVYFLPGFTYVLISCSLPSVPEMVPAMIFGFVLSSALIYLMGSLRQEFSSFHAIGATLLLTLASFLYLWGIAYVLVVWIFLMYLRSWSWREMVGSLLGIILPVFLTMSLLYLSEADLTGIIQDIYTAHWIHTASITNWPLSVWVLLGFMGLLFLISFPTLAGTMQTARSISRKGFSLMTTVAVVTIVLFLILPGYHPELYWILAIPLAMVYAGLFSLMRSRKWANILIFTWITLILWVRIHLIFI